MAPDRRGLSLAEVAIALMVIVVSAIPVLELIRSSTVSVEMSEVEIAVRTFAGDVLQRFAGSTVGGTGKPLVSPQTEAMLAAPFPADVLLASDPYLSRNFPRTEMETTLKRAQAMVKLTVGKPTHPSLANADGLDQVLLTVTWNDVHDNRKELVLGRFVSR